VAARGMHKRWRPRVACSAQGPASAALACGWPMERPGSGACRMMLSMLRAPPGAAACPWGYSRPDPQRLLPAERIVYRTARRAALAVRPVLRHRRHFPIHSQLLK
jgi:hypothetical protein